MKRRDFIKTATWCAGAASVTGMWEIVGARSAGAVATSGGLGVEGALYFLEKGKEKNINPELRPEIKNNPRAVFLVETHVEGQPDASLHFTDASPQLNAAGKDIASQVFVKGSKKGGAVYIKPNFTYIYPYCYNRTTGVYSSPDFIAGMVTHLRDIGCNNMVAGEGPTEASNHRSGGIYGAFDPVGLKMIEAGYDRFTNFKKEELNWLKTKNSLLWKQIPVIRPIGDPDTFMINISTMKPHMTAITTLTTKNLQGCVPVGYGQFCTPWDSLEAGAENAGIPFKRDFYSDFQQRIEASYVKHAQAGFKRWDHTGSYKRYQDKGGWAAYSKAKKNPDDLKAFMEGVGELMQHEMWLNRGLDNASAIMPQLNVIEGIIGLDGEELNRDHIGRDRLCNIVVMGMSPFEVDAVGTYLMGHDPKEVWYTRVAKERGLGENDINKIEINWIRNGEIVPVKKHFRA